MLEKFQIPFEIVAISAHRNPKKLEDYVKKSKSEVFIAIAGLSAALPGVIASQTTKPVIGVPVKAALNGLDALLSIVQMPKGIPVACVGIGRADNAALLAIEIVALSDKKLKKKLDDYRSTL